MVGPKVHRFEIWLIQLDPTKGSGIKKTRPCVILSPDEMAALKTVIVAPMTSKGFSFPTRIKCRFQNKNSFILLDQLRAVDKRRLVSKSGTLLKSTQKKVAKCLAELFAW